MRHVSLRAKINIAILLAFLAAALAFGGILTRYMGARQAATQNRARMLLAAVAAHRLESLAPMLDKREQLAAAQDILDRVIRVDGVTEASLFDAAGTLLAFAGSRPPQTLGEDGGDSSPPSGRVFTVAASTADGRLTAALVEPVRNAAGSNVGYLRLAYSLGEISDLNHHTWVVFAAAVVAAYCLLAGLLNLLLHRLVLSPVDTLRQGLEAVQAGRLGQSVPVRSQDAMGRMAMAFNAMSARLKETSEALASSRDAIEENRRLLARRVEERTAELARTNTRLTAEVTARREAEGRLQRALALYEAILEATAEGMICVSPLHSGELLAYNRRFLELWGLPEDWSGRPRQERMQCFLGKFADPEAARVAYEDLMDEETRQETAIVALRDGRFFERRTGPILLQNACIGRVFSYVDVTAEMQRQARTQREKTQAEDANRAKSAFLAVMSHEIRTPLNVVIGLTEELLAGEASDEQRDHLDVIQQSAAHLLGVVNDILDFSKIEAGKLVLESVDFRVRELVAGAADAFAREARRKGLDFSVLVAEEVPQFLCGDPQRLRQVLLNLLGNAVKFTELGSIALTFELAAPAAAPSGRVGLVIRVADTGIGIPQDRIAGIFEDFQQGGGSIARRFGGTGLGLAICKGILERMDGTIGAESRPGKGSVFTCTAWLLPGHATAAPGVEAPVGSVQRLKRRRGPPARHPHGPRPDRGELRRRSLRPARRGTLRRRAHGYRDARGGRHHRHPGHPGRRAAGAAGPRPRHPHHRGHGPCRGRRAQDLPGGRHERFSHQTLEFPDPAPGPRPDRTGRGGAPPATGRDAGGPVRSRSGPQSHGHRLGRIRGPGPRRRRRRRATAGRSQAGHGRRRHGARRHRGPHPQGHGRDHRFRRLPQHRRGAGKSPARGGYCRRGQGVCGTGRPVEETGSGLCRLAAAPGKMTPPESLR